MVAVGKSPNIPGGPNFGAYQWKPKTVILSSANFGNSDWTEWTVTLHSEDAFRFCLTEFQKLLSQAVVVKF